MCIGEKEMSFSGKSRRKCMNFDNNIIFLMKIFGGLSNL